MRVVYAAGMGSSFRSVRFKAMLARLEEMGWAAA
jgi:hypothetical protein